MKLKNIIFAVNIVAIIFVAVYLIRVWRIKETPHPEPIGDIELRIKYNNAISYIDLIPQIYELSDINIGSISMTSLDGEQSFDLEDIKKEGCLYLYISSQQCKDCVNHALSSIPKINEIMGEGRLTVLSDGFSSKSLYLIKEKIKANSPFYSIKAYKDCILEDAQRPILFMISDSGDIKYPFAPDKDFENILQSYLYEIKDK